MQSNPIVTAANQIITVAGETHIINYADLL